MSARDAILERIHRNRPKGDFPLPPAPDFASVLPSDLADDLPRLFGERLERMGGRVLPIEPDDPLAPVRARVMQAGIVASAVPEVAGGRSLDGTIAPARLADVDLAVVRAVFGVAETGSVLFTQAELRVNAVAYLAQHLLVLLDPADLVPDIQAAYRRPEFARAAYAVLHTGPSATADIEGVLIHGAQGVRSLAVAFVPRGATPA